ncbi:MAG: ATP-binding protein [Nocardioidaceae bacterium]
MSDQIYSLELHREFDVFAARQAGREVAAAVGLEGQDLVRVATALSEVSRDVVAAGGGRVAFSLTPPDLLTVELVTFGPAPQIGEQAAVLGGGVEAAQRLVDSLTLDTNAEGHAIIRLDKRAGSRPLHRVRRLELEQRVAATVRSPLEELRLQNRELILALEDVQARRDELVRVNTELEETNRGVMALYNELSGELETTNQGVVALYAEIDDKSRQLREASEAKSRFLRNISHELRTPGNSVLGLARLLLDANAEPLTDEQRHQVEFIEASAMDLVRLVNELLDLSRAESGRLEAHMQDVDLPHLFGELRGTTAPLVTRSEVSLVVEDAGPVGTIRTDPALLGHVLRNLLSNAVKFTESGEVRMSAVREGARVRFTVQDTGIGIAPEDQPHVFEEFFQVPSPLHAGVKGSGLGLPFARLVANILGGDLQLSSARGVGTTFVMELPADGLPTGPQGGRQP